MNDIAIQTKHTRAIYSLWLNWTLPILARMGVIVGSLWISPLWMPLVALAFAAIFASYARRNTHQEVPHCGVVPFVMSRIFFWGAMVMYVLAYAFKHGTLHHWIGEVNPEYPYIPVLILAPVSMLVSGYAIVRGHRLSHCAVCIIERGQPAEQGFIGRIYRQEGHLQLRFLFRLSLVMTLLASLYYAFIYINVNLNIPDIIAFIWIPVIIYAGTIIYMGIRYFSLWMYYARDFRGGDVDFGSYTRLRYLIIDNQERIFLTHESGDNVDKTLMGRLDSPAVFSFRKRANIPLAEADRMFRDFMPADADCRVRFMYESRTVDGQSNTFHFIATINNPDVLDNSSLKGEWLTLAQVDRYLNSGMLSPMLSAELYRLHTITMAWKSYDRNGKRLYNIKHYHPVFRLKGIQDWDVDFNDPEWLKVAVYNQDRPFYHLRRWWLKHVHGLS